MAKNKRQKVKHYNRSFYSRETRVKRGIGIVVLVAAVLAAAWFAAPHVLDWATHTWYTVVKDRDLEAESASRAEAAASSAAAAALLLRRQRLSWSRRRKSRWTARPLPAAAGQSWT